MRLCTLHALPIGRGSKSTRLPGCLVHKGQETGQHVESRVPRARHDAGAGVGPSTPISVPVCPALFLMRTSPPRGLLEPLPHALPVSKFSSSSVSLTSYRCCLTSHHEDHEVGAPGLLKGGLLHASFCSLVSVTALSRARNSSCCAPRSPAGLCALPSRCCFACWDFFFYYSASSSPC